MTGTPKTLLVLLLGFACLGAAAQAQQQEVLACSIDAPVVELGATVALRAWTDARDVDWQVSGGTLVEGSGDRRVWRLPGRTGRFTANASSGGGLAHCSLSVFVVGDLRSPLPPPPTTPAPVGRESGTMFLVKGQAEPAGYGLYSYFLLGAPPANEAARERVTKAIEAFLAMTPSLTALEGMFERGELNANQMPVEAPTPGDKPSAQWILEHYDYARARAILSRIDGTLRQGPYLVSVLQPAGTRGGALPAPLLLQDLSAVPAHLVGDWYRLFLNQATQEHFWESRKLEAVGVRMRTIVGVLALGLPDVQGAVRQWVTWGK